jgi:hypothetical protein
MRFLTFFTVTLFLLYSAIGQTCTCESNFEWLTFFRSGHIGIEHLTNETTSSQIAQKTEICEGDISQFEKYIDSKKEADYESIWEIGDYKIGIKKEGTNHIGFIIEADVDSWREPEQIKLKTEQDGDNLKSTYYMRNYSMVENYFKSINSQHPYIEELNATTLYLRIPSFGYEDKSASDRVLSENKDELLKT